MKQALTNPHILLPVVIYWCESTDGILHFVFVTSVAFYLSVLLQNILCCFHTDWKSARLGSTRNQQEQQQLNTEDSQIHKQLVTKTVQRLQL